MKAYVPNSNTTKDVLLIALAILAGIVVACLPIGCATCRECKGDEVQPSPQSPAKATWQPARVPLPNPVPVPPPAPRVPQRDFQTPPSDGPDTPPVAPVVPVPSVPPAPPAPAPAPAPNGTAEMTTTSRASGAINILGNTGTITLGNTGVPVASPQADPAMAPQPQQIPIGAIVAVASNPQVQSVILASARRIGGGISYALTGRCPGAPAVAPAPSAYAMVPQQTYQAVPVQMVQAAPQYVMQAPASVQASPQLMLATPAAPKKCRLFGK